jgi:L-asparaginase
MTVDQMLSIGRIVDETLSSDGVDGVVILHGTATLEESAYFLHLVSAWRKPVVVVGAMRPANGLGSDAAINLLNAFRVAASPQAHGRGVLVILNDAIHSARDVTKAATWGLDAFVSRAVGPLGHVNGYGKVEFLRSPTRPHTAETPFTADIPALPRVDIVVSYLGAGGDAIRAAVDGGARGIVVACTGSDGLTVPEEAALADAVEQGVTVVLGSRTGSGPTIASPLQRSRGYLGAGDLLPWKARILLMLGLQSGYEGDALQALFDTY